ncbi:MAG TPA: NAD(P)-binding domain-containing protein, partial [Solirubrobacteraceae bacterium]|nr:NAD(P)-binding domain-containing protein [Solirubrobacteraceae bacterium]
MLAADQQVKVYGRVMGFWEEHMPAGMLVRSAWSASSLSDPRRVLTLDTYEAEQPSPFPRPLPGAELPRYGHWFQERAVPDVDERLVATVERHATDGFALTLADGERHTARRVVIATGLASFPHRPAQFAELGANRVTHSMDVPGPARFTGQSVAVIGCGQSAVETAALLCEADAGVELIARAPGIRWLIRGERLRGIDPLLQRVLYAPTDVGPAGVSRLVALPNLFRRLPRRLQDRLAYRSVRPAATSWLADRVAGVTTTFARHVTRAHADGEGVSLTLDDGSHRLVDHVILATGYRIDVAREAVLDESLRAGLRTHDGNPVLGAGFESSLPGLHFVGAYSAWSFGPIMRFVAGTAFTAR